MDDAALKRLREAGWFVYRFLDGSVRFMCSWATTDEAVEALCTKLLYLMPDCTAKTLTSLRKHKTRPWDEASPTNREWLALNMMTEAKAGFRAFNEGPKGRREVDFIALRQLLAEGHPWDDELVRAVSPQYRAED